MMNDGMMNGMHGGMVWMALCAVFGIILLAGVVLLIVWVVKSFSSKGGRNLEEALNILKKRYANGEITREEYEKMKHDIS